MLLDFDKPKKIRSNEEHNEMYSSDCDVPGTYVPNMGKEDMLKWKAKHIKGDNERVEIRKTVRGISNYAQMVIIIYKNHEGKGPEIVISTNSKLGFSPSGYKELTQAIDEARSILEI